jgi:hypothetical protein
MLVSHRMRFIYLKTQKTGGTSVESYFEPYCMPPGIWRESHAREEHVSADGIVGFRGLERGEGVVWFNHMGPGLIRRRLGWWKWRRYFKFCVVRNPYDKEISAFFYNRRRTLGADGGGEDLRQSFLSYLERANPVCDDTFYLFKGRFALDAVVRYERLHEDLEAVCRRLRLPWEPERLPRFKAGIRPADATAASLYSEAARAIVERHHADSIARFGYTFPE